MFKCYEYVLTTVGDTTYSLVLLGNLVVILGKLTRALIVYFLNDADALNRTTTARSNESK